MIRSIANRKGASLSVPPSVWTALAAVTLALAVTAASVSDAVAHAVLLATEPADGSVLETQPDEIVLRFNEPVAPVFVRVIGPDGRPMTTPDPIRAIDTDLRLRLQADSSEGGYLVSYRGVSADSHPVGGAFSFAVGAAAALVAPPPDAAAGREALWQAAKILLRLVQNVALMLAAGGALFGLLVLRGRDRVPGLEPMILAGAVVAVLAAVIGIGVQGGLLAAGPVSVLADPETWDLGASTTLGQATLVMVPALAVVALATGVSVRPLARAVAGVAGIVAVASLALTGHSAAAGWPAQTALVLHGATVAFWLGALWPLHTIVRTRSPDEAVILVRRFSAVAIPAVVLLLVAGTGTALTRLDDPAMLVDSAYGRTLLLKLAVVVPLLRIALANRWRLTPALAAGSARAAMALARNIRFECALAGTILLATAVLAHTAPPHDPANHDHHDHTAEAAPGYTAVTVSRGRMLFLEVAPARTGTNAITLRLSGAEDRPFSPLEVTAAFSLPSAGIEPLARAPQRTGEGRYTLTRLDLPVAGRWQVRVDALISDFEKVTFRVDIPIPSRDGGTPDQGQEASR